MSVAMPLFNHSNTHPFLSAVDVQSILKGEVTNSPHICAMFVWVLTFNYFNTNWPKCGLTNYVFLNFPYFVIYWELCTYLWSQQKSTIYWELYTYLWGQQKSILYAYLWRQQKSTPMRVFSLLSCHFKQRKLSSGSLNFSVSLKEC